MSAWLLKLIISLMPEPKTIFKIVIFILFFPIVLIAFFSFPISITKNIPIVSPSQTQIYIDAALEVEKGKDVVIDWKQMVAIDAVLLENHFKKTNHDRAVRLANRFIYETTEKRDRKIVDSKTGKFVIVTETVTVYKVKTFDEVLQELVSEGILKTQQIQNIYAFYKFDMDSLKDVGDGSDMPADWKPVITTYNWPLPGYYRLSSKYGPRVHPVENIDGFHHGIDIPAPRGTDILAIKDGFVKSAGFLNLKAGKGVILVHPNGSQSKYFHLSSVSVKRNAKIKANEKIGEVGSTGSSTGNHLHFGIYVKGKSVDPLKFY